MLARGAAPAGEQADAGLALVADDVVGVVAIARLAGSGDEARQSQARAEVDQHVLKRPHVAIGLHHRLADGVARPFGAADRPVEQRDAIPALEIGRVGQHQIGVGDHLRVEGVGVDDARNLVVAARRLVAEHAGRLGGVHRRVPAHIRHVEEERVDRVGIAGPGVADHHVHQAVQAERRIPGERLVDAARRAVAIDQQILGRQREPERRPRHGVAGSDLMRVPGRLHRRRDRAWIGRLVAPRARRIDRAEQHLQHMDGAAGVKAIRMGGDAAHRVHADGPADHLRVPPARAVRPGNVERDLLLEGGRGQLAGDAPDGFRGDAAARGHRVRGILRIETALGEQVQGGNRAPAIRQHHLAGEARRDVRRLRVDRRVAARVPGERAALGIARKEPVIGLAGVADDEPGRVGVAGEEGEIDPFEAQQFVDERKHQQAVGAGADAQPLVGNGRIAGAHGVDRDDLDAAPAQLAEADLDRVRIMVLGDAEQQEVARMVPIGLAEFPERAADRVEPGGCHVDGAEAAMRRVIGRAELACPPAGQSLRLVASGEESELARVAAADGIEPLGGGGERVVPFDLAELAAAARADPAQGLGQPRRRILLHDAGSALGAEHAAVHGVVAVALDVADAAILEMHFDAATAGAHVAGGASDPVPRGMGCSRFHLRHSWASLSRTAIRRQFSLLGGNLRRCAWAVPWKRLPPVSIYPRLVPTESMAIGGATARHAMIDPFRARRLR